MPLQSFLLLGKAYVASRDPCARDHFVWLQNFAPNLKFEDVQTRLWPPLLQRQGPWASNSLLLFPNDGIVSPDFFAACAHALPLPPPLPPRARLLEIFLGDGGGGG